MPGMKSGGSLALPDNLVQLISAAESARGFPAGTLLSVMQQETGGSDKYLKDPTAYHYGLNADGKRIAGHTGKVSTAFGPFGILESTAANPGYGVAPMKDKTLEEQVRFSADYLAARSKSAGSLQGGLAGYGEGTKYAAQVESRIPSRSGGGSAAPASVPAAVAASPVQVAATSAAEAPVAVAAAATSEPLPGALAGAADQSAWVNFLKSMPQGKAMQVASMNYGAPQLAIAPPQMSALAPIRNVVPNFEAFSGFGKRRA